jgi:hypothetical protein
MNSVHTIMLFRNVNFNCNLPSVPAFPSSLFLLCYHVILLTFCVYLLSPPTVAPSPPVTMFFDLTTKLYGLSPRANYTDRATAACR